MDNKRPGLIIIGISILSGILLLAFNSRITQLQTDSCACANTCDATHEPSFLAHSGIAIVVATLTLGSYLLFFEKPYKTLIKRLRQDVSLKSREERFSLILLGLNEGERKVLGAVKNLDGITQHTLGIRTDMHKSRLSIIVGTLEEKGLIKKEKKGKTNKLFLRINLDSSPKHIQPP